MMNRLVKPRRPLLWAPVASPPDIYKGLCALDGESALALRFLVLTASLSSQVTEMEWREVDLQAGVWTVPAARNPLGQDHRIPLPTQALAVLQMVPPKGSGSYVFDLGTRPQLRSMVLQKTFRRHAAGSRLHAIRPAFTGWATQHFLQSPNAIRLCLSHAPQPDPIALFRKHDDMFDQRAAIMQEWADYAASTAHEKSAT